MLLAVSYFATEERARQDRLYKAIVIEAVLIHSSQLGSISEWDELTRSYLGTIYSSAARQIFRAQSRYYDALWEYTSSLDLRTKDLLNQAKRNYENLLLPKVKNGYYRRSIQSRFDFNNQCKLVAYRGPKDRTLFVGSFILGIFHTTSKMSNAYIVNSSDPCVYFKVGIGSLFLIKLKAEKESFWMIGLPSKVFHRAFDIELITKLNINKIKIRRKVFLSEFGPYEIKFIRSQNEYIFAPEDYYKGIALSEAQRLTGKYRDNKDIIGAMNDLADFRDANASFVGIGTTRRFVINFAPIICLLITYVMYRRVKFIKRFETPRNEPWIFLSDKNWIEKFFLMVLATSPILIVVIFYGAFSYLNGVGIEIFGRNIGWWSWVGLPDPVAITIPFKGVNIYARLLLVFFVINFVLATNVSLFFGRLVLAR